MKSFYSYSLCSYIFAYLNNFKEINMKNKKKENHQNIKADRQLGILSFSIGKKPLCFAIGK